MTEIIMPKLSDSMDEGTILTWLKQDGEHVQAGEDLVEIETDKATMTHPADASGVLSIIAAEGTTLAVGASIATLGDAAANTAPPSAPVPEEADSPPVPDADARPASESPLGSSSVEIGAPAGAPVGDGNGASAGLIRSTPLARRVAAAHGIALEEVAGTGPGGRVTRADVLIRAGVAPEASPLPASPPTTPATAPIPVASARPAAIEEAPPPGAKGNVEIVELTRLQTVVARRMAESKATVPHFQVQTEAVMDAAIAFRAQIKAIGETPPSFNDLIVKAAAIALRAHPRANGAYRNGRFELYSRVNAGIAVAAQDALVVPTIFDVDHKSLGTIASEARRLAASVREATITPAELAGATFTVSNLGMYGMSAITPVINSPQAAILGVGAMRSHLVRTDDEIVEQQLMTLTLSCDHRILYGADAARFLSDIRACLEQPLQLAL